MDIQLSLLASLIDFRAVADGLRLGGDCTVGWRGSGRTLVSKISEDQLFSKSLQVGPIPRPLWRHTGQGFLWDSYRSVRQVYSSPHSLFTFTPETMTEHRLAVKVIGVGGTGCCLLPPLCRLLNYGSNAYSFPEVELSLIDGDQYEERDRDRQTFRELGNKAEVAARAIGREFSALKVTAHPVFLDKTNARLFLQEGDIAFLCVNNHRTRRTVSRHCEGSLKNVVVISGGMDYTTGSIQVFIRKDGENLTDPLDSKFHPEIANAVDEYPTDAKSAKAATRPQLLITNNMAAAVMLNAFHDWKTGAFCTTSPVRYDEVQFDLASNQSRPISRSQTPGFMELVQEKRKELEGRRRKP